MSEWRVALRTEGGMQVGSEKAFITREHHGDDLVVMSVFNRYSSADDGGEYPDELVFFVDIRADDDTQAVSQAAKYVNNYVALLSFVVNSHIEVAEPFVAWETASGQPTRRFWQRVSPRTRWVPRPARLLDHEAAAAFLGAVLQSSELPRLYRAFAQYHQALSYWRSGWLGLALAHLYMAIEALTPAVQRKQQSEAGCSTDEEFAQSLGVDMTDPKWRGALASRVRRDFICAGDDMLYREARKASDGFEHGFADVEALHKASDRHTRALFGHVRTAIIDLLDLTEDVIGQLDKGLIDSSPIAFEVRGEITTSRSPLDLGPNPWTPPHVDADVRVQSVTVVDGDTLRYTPVISGTAVIARGVSLRIEAQRLEIGLNDPASFQLGFPDGGASSHE